MTKPILLVGDLGGTNARFALARHDAPGYTDHLCLPCAEFASAEDALDDYLARTGAPQPNVIALAVAGPVVDGAVRFINSDWQIEQSSLEARFPSAQVLLINDFGAIAYAIPKLAASDMEPIGQGRQLDLGHGDFTVAIIGPGTGLGAGGLMRRAGILHPIVGEGGHRGFAPESETQIALLQQLRKRFERVSDERLLSGAGLENILLALQAMHGKEPQPATAADLFRCALAGGDELASETTRLFFEILGQVAGNLALAFGAWDGVYIAGGIVPRYPELLRASRFRAGFENKGRYRALMERIPTLLITHPQPGLLGAACMARILTGDRNPE